MIIQHKNGLLLMRDYKLGESDWRQDSTYKMIFSPQGQGVYQTNRNDITINKNAFIVLNPLDQHRQLCVTNEKFLVELSPELLKETAELLNLPKRSPEFALQPTVNLQIIQWVNFVRDYINSDGLIHEEKALFFDHSVTQLVLLLFKYGIGSHQQSFPSSLKADVNIKKVIDALKEGYMDTWSLNRMALISGMNKYQFSHLFKETTGVSPYSWLQIYRIIKSQKMLIQTDQSIISIALDCGFASISSYNLLFKKLYGRSPRAFRQQFSDIH